MNNNYTYCSISHNLSANHDARNRNLLARGAGAKQFNVNSVSK